MKEFSIGNRDSQNGKRKEVENLLFTLKIHLINNLIYFRDSERKLPKVCNKITILIARPHTAN